MKKPGTGLWPFDELALKPKASDARVAVLGLARSGWGAARLLCARGARVDLLDLEAPSGTEEAALLDRLIGQGARPRFGPHDPAWLAEIALLVKSPGVSGSIPFLQEARRRGIPIIGELELAFLAARGPVLAITGTNGKSTTTAWAGDILRRAGQAHHVAGNIGRAFSEAVLEDPERIFVLEVSSFQLEDTRAFHPRVAVILNLTPDHLDRHGDLRAYLEAKLRIFERQETDDVALLGPDEDLARRARPRIRGRLLRFAAADTGEDGAFLRGEMLFLRRGGREVPLLPRGDLSLPGPHNLENALAAAASTAALGAEAEAIRASLAGFPGLPHRLEPVGSIGGVRFVNDSKATNTDSLAVALRSFTGKVTLIAGGRDKGQDFGPLRDLVQSRVARLILIGEAREKMEEAWAGVPSRRAGSLEEAVEMALGSCRAGETVLLSPACASFDMFADYEDRGERFRAAVLARRRGSGEETLPAKTAG